MLRRMMRPCGKLGRVLRAMAATAVLMALGVVAQEKQAAKTDSTVLVDMGLLNIIFCQQNVYLATFEQKYLCDAARQASSPDDKVAAFLSSHCRDSHQREVEAREQTKRAIAERAPMNACETQFVDFWAMRMVIDAKRNAAKKLTGSRGAAPIATQHFADADSLEKAEQEGEFKFHQMGCRCATRKDNGVVAEAPCDPLQHPSR